MRIQIRFIDNELVEADSDSVHQGRLLFVAQPRGGNNQLVWISFTSVKYVTFPDTPPTPAAADPGRLRGLRKVVLRFADGEVMRAYKDDAFGQEGHCFNVHFWDDAQRTLRRAIVSVYALKAVFFVEHWDSRYPAA